jgi:hypothetical protein
MTAALPKGVNNFNRMDNVGVTDVASIIGLITALRLSLIQVSNIKLASVGKNEKMETIYNYLSGPEFRQKIEGIVEAFKSMQADLDQEKRAMHKIWSKREKQTVKMHGEMEGIIGAVLPQIETFELKALTEGSKADLYQDDSKQGVLIGVSHD